MTSPRAARGTSRRPFGGLDAAYVVLAGVTSVTAATGPRAVHGVTKLLLAPTLQLDVLRGATGAPDRLLLLATAGSLVGDWFMFREGSAPTPAAARREMRCGAVAFGCQQALFVARLHARGARPSRGALAGVAAGLAGLALVERSRTGRVDPILATYGALLGAMTAWAQGDDAGVRAGGALFLASDALIVVREHAIHGPRARAAAQVAVMLSYSAALGLLVRGLEG